MRPSRITRTLFTLAAVLAATALVPVRGAAFTLRSPQVAFDIAPLQAWLNAADGNVNVATDQLDAQRFPAKALGCFTGDFAAWLGLSGDVQFGLYDAHAHATPTRYALLGPGSAAGSSAWVRFKPGVGLSVIDFDANGVLQASVTYPGVTGDSLGFYAASPAGLWYSEDVRNADGAHLLAYAGTGVNYGTLFVAVEPGPRSEAAPGTFTGTVLAIGPPGECGLPVQRSSWGSLRVRYR